MIFEILLILELTIMNALLFVIAWDVELMLKYPKGSIIVK